MATIRPATLADLDALCALERRAFATDRLSRRSLRRQLAEARNALLVAEEGGVLAGYALVLFRAGSRAARLYSLAVGAGHAGRGLGRALLAATEAAARGRGCHVIRLEVHEANRRAARLYEQAGYAAFGRLARYYADGASAVRYRKALRPHKPV